MSLFALCRYNHIFQSCGAFSQSLGGSCKMPQLIRDTQFFPDTRVYMDYGSEEMKNHSKILEALKRSTGAFLDKQVNVCMRIVPGGQHCEACWERQIPVFMRCLELEK